MNKRFPPTALVAFFALFCVMTAKAQSLWLPRIISDHAVLQREMPIPVWGKAAPGSKVTVSFHQQTKSVKAAKDGRWSLSLDAEAAGGPYSLVVSSKGKSLTISDVLVGEVWICSGQSNMEWPLAQTDNAAKEIAAANYPLIRHIKVPRQTAEAPKDDFTDGAWESCSPATSPNFTAVGYYFAQRLHQAMPDVPIGLINTSWGGTNVETWISAQTIGAMPDFDKYPARSADELKSAARKRNQATYDMLAKMGINENKVVEDQAAWIAPNADLSKWGTIKAPGNWENSLPGLDGVVYYRRTFELPANAAAQSATLYAGLIDDNDITWVNGVKVGETNSWDTPRAYRIPDGLLKAGTNVVVIRADDTGGGGGIWGEEANLRIDCGSNFSLPLAGEWRFMIGKIYMLTEIGPNDYPCLLYNAMIAPLVPYAIRGAIWYQGESNAGRAYQYRTTFPAMIKDWRQHWGQGDFPFYFVQLSDWKADYGNSQKGSTWAELREAQTQTLALPNTGMAVTIDIGNEEDIHPRNKLDVGYRLAANALKYTYGKDLVPCGPLYAGMKIDGNKAIVRFDHIGGGLEARHNKYGYLHGFEIAGEGKQFYWAKAIIQGNQIVVFSEKVPRPVAVRYGWADHPEDLLNLYNAEGFPASPFRTDQWKGITEDVKY